MSFILPYEGQGMLISQRSSSVDGSIRGFNRSPRKIFISATVIRDRLGLPPIRKLKITRNKPKKNKIDEMNKKYIKQIEDICKDTNEIIELSKEANNQEKIKKKFKVYKKKCDEKEKMIQTFRKVLEKKGNSSSRNALLCNLTQDIRKNNKQESEEEKGTIIEESHSNLNLKKNIDNDNKEKNVCDEKNKSGEDFSLKITEEKEEELEEDIKNIVDYFSHLDFNSYMKDQEIKEALQLIKNKMEKENNQESPKKEDPPPEEEKKEDSPQDPDNKEESPQDKVESTPKPIIDMEKENLKEKIESYRFIENLAKNEPVKFIFNFD